MVLVCEQTENVRTVLGTGLGGNFKRHLEQIRHERLILLLCFFAQVASIITSCTHSLTSLTFGGLSNLKHI